jgi:hypothetical protein
MKEEQREEFVNKIALLTAENENLATQNKKLKSENEVLKQQLSTLKSLLSIYELGKKPPEIKEEIPSETKKHASLSYLRSEKFSTRNHSSLNR